MPSNTTCNKKLKAIADLCGIKTHLTYHVARHSAATTILLSNGVPIETVSRLLGAYQHKDHSNLREDNRPKDKSGLGTVVRQVGGYGEKHLQCHLITHKEEYR
mgnify:CR=1 FL=1